MSTTELSSIQRATQAYLVSREYPSKRSVKNKSGRSGRKQANGSSFLQVPGHKRIAHTSVGTLNSVRSIYDQALTQVAIVVDQSVGWCTDGTPNRL